MAKVTTMDQLVVGQKYKVNGFDYWLQRADIAIHRCGKTTFDLQFRSNQGDIQVMGRYEVDLNLCMEGREQDVLARLPIEVPE